MECILDLSYLDVQEENSHIQGIRLYLIRKNTDDYICLLSWFNKQAAEISIHLPCPKFSLIEIKRDNTDGLMTMTITSTDFDFIDSGHDISIPSTFQKVAPFSETASKTIKVPNMEDSSLTKLRSQLTITGNIQLTTPFISDTLINHYDIQTQKFKGYSPAYDIFDCGSASVEICLPPEKGLF